MAVLSSNMRNRITPEKYKQLYFLLGFFVLFYAPKLVFILFQLGNDLVRLAGIAMIKLGGESSGIMKTGELMSRAEFLTKTGIVIAVIPFISVIHGIKKGRFNYKVKKLSLNFDNLPPSFDGFRVMQLSDWHIGSFIGHRERVEEAVELINQQEADLILFTGDMVNNVAEEMQEFIPVLKKIRAPYGVYSVLGNHDYGDYVNWSSEEEYKANLQKLFAYQEEAGFRLLRNEAVEIKINDEQIALGGVENWGLPPFPQYGDLRKTLKSAEGIPFKILMSHDPSHWDAEVRKEQVELTLSGHTHGMQFGINIPGIKWSPVKWKYPRWQGLYEEDKQKLYVNVGIGYLAFPGRVGFPPEITVLELHRS
jgi:predicted MPP superfamily phosphohydrolase